MRIRCLYCILGCVIIVLCMVEASSSSWPPSQWLTSVISPHHISHPRSVKFKFIRIRCLYCNINLTDLGCARCDVGLLHLYVSHWLGGQDDELASTMQSHWTCPPRAWLRVSNSICTFNIHKVFYHFIQSILSVDHVITHCIQEN